MKTITVKQIIKDKKLFNQKLLCGVFALFGFGTVLLPFIKRNDLSDKNFVIGIMFMTVVFGIPIGYFAGLRKIIEAIRLEKTIKNKDITIEKDVVTNKKIIAGNDSLDTMSDYCQISYKNYSQRNNKVCIVKRSEYEKTKKGDIYYMIYENKKGNLIHRYPAKEYEISDELKNNRRQEIE